MLSTAMQNTFGRLGHFGYITPRMRTQKQSDAHAAAMAHIPKFKLLAPKLISDAARASPVKVILTQLWSDPDCVADMGKVFTGFHQLTGSCVGVSEGNAICTLSCVQRKLATGPTRAFIPWWLFPYGRTRLAEGDRGQGEGAVDSVMGQTLATEGIFDVTQQGLPQFKTDDGFYLTESIEMAYSDGNYSGNTSMQAIAKASLLGSKATVSSTEEIKASIINGYPILDGCDNYIGNGRIVGSGDTTYVTGTYDSSGGHSTCYLGYWDHPNDGPLFLYSNQWPTSTYPTDPAGGGRCCVWVKEANVAKLFRTGGSGGETMALSHQGWFPAQPSVTDWFI